MLDKSKIIKQSQEKGGEWHVKCFDAWTHLVVMLYAVISRFDSLREITTSLQAEARKLSHLGIFMMTSMEKVQMPLRYKYGSPLSPICC
ncbi:MAG: DUF4372 domain-containing protein [Muribaculaceae bacterium]